jgi:hypothetical protein
MYLQYCDGMELYNNTMWRGTVGGVCLGPDARNVTCNNNIFSTVNLYHLDVTFNASQHGFDYNLIGLANQGLPLQTNDTWAPNPLFKNIPAVVGGTLSDNVTADDFSLLDGSPAINKGRTGTGIPATDFFGNPRVGAPDLGAIEYQGTGIDLGIEEIAEIKLRGIAVKANPFNNVIQVKAETRIRSLSLYTMDGLCICQRRDSECLLTAGVASGVYLLKAEKVYRTVLVKVIKQ